MDAAEPTVFSFLLFLVRLGFAVDADAPEVGDRGTSAKLDLPNGKKTRQLRKYILSTETQSFHWLTVKNVDVQIDIVCWQRIHSIMAGPKRQAKPFPNSPPFQKSSLTDLRVRSPSIRVTSRFRVRHLSWTKTYSRFDSNTTPPKCPRKQRIQKTSLLWK